MYMRYMYIYVYLKEASSARARSLSRIVDCSPAFFYLYMHTDLHINMLRAE